MRFSDTDLHEVAFGGVIDDDSALQIPIEAREILDVDAFHGESMVPEAARISNEVRSSRKKMKNMQRTSARFRLGKKIRRRFFLSHSHLYNRCDMVLSGSS